MEKTQKSFDFQKSHFQLPEQSYLEAVFPDMQPDEEESDEMDAKIPMATLGRCSFYGIKCFNAGICHAKIQIKWKNECL